MNRITIKETGYYDRQTGRQAGRQAGRPWRKWTHEEILSELEEDHNHSWFEEVFERNQNRRDKPSMFYRGTTFSYGDFFDLVYQYAAALKQVGLSKGDEFVACLRLTPDYPVLVGAASLTGTVINLISSDFDKDYIAQIINNSSAPIVKSTWTYE